SNGTTTTKTTVNESILSFSRNLNSVTQSDVIASGTESGFAESGFAMIEAFSIGGGSSLEIAGSTSVFASSVSVVSPPIQATQIPFDVEVQDLPNGGVLLMQLGSAAAIRSIQSIANSPMKWGQQAGTTSLVTVNSPLSFPGHSTADIRELVFYETLTPILTL